MIVRYYEQGHLDSCYHEQEQGRSIEDVEQRGTGIISSAAGLGIQLVRQGGI
jgi:hypothetical protein